MNSLHPLTLDEGRYKVRKTIAATPWSIVHEVYDTERDARFAAKVLHVGGPHAETAKSMWERERAALDGLIHPSVIKLERSFVEGDKMVLILELVPGGATLETLIDTCAAGRRLRPDPLWRLQQAQSLLSAIAAAHERNVIHRDIKPANVLLVQESETEHCRLKLADFGVSLVLALAARSAPGVTLREFHTRPYAAPEQLLQRTVSMSADVHAFGMLAAVLLSLHRVVEDAGGHEVRSMMDGVMQEFTAAGAAPQAFQELADLLTASLAEESSDRPRLPLIEQALERLIAQVRPRTLVGIKLTTTVREKMISAGYADAGALLADMNQQLRISAKDGDRGMVIDCFGRTSFIRLKVDASGKPLVAVDLRRKSAHEHDLGRRNAMPCMLELTDKPASGEALMEIAELARADERAASTDELISCADKIIRFEKDRLARLVADYDLGKERPDSSQGFLQARAAGLTSCTVDQVSLHGLVDIPLTDLRPWSRRGKPAARIESEKKTGHAAVEASDELVLARFEQLSPFFERPEDIAVKTKSGGKMREFGRVVAFDEDRFVLKVRISSKQARINRVGELQLINDQADRVLEKQRAALDTLKTNGAVRQDLYQMLFDAGAHRHGEASPVKLIQKGLVGADEITLMVQNILSAEGLFLVQGPPGAGKTTLITEVVMQALSRNPNIRVGIVSQANDAVFNVFEKLLELMKVHGKQFTVCRDVRDDRAQEEGEFSGFAAALKKFSAQVTLSVPNEGDGTFVPGNALLRDWIAAVENGSHGIRDDFAALVQAWCVTLLRSPSCLDKAGADAFDLLIIDEAAKATVAETLVPLVRSRRILMVGDHRQLPPYLDRTTGKELEQAGISTELAKRSLFEHLFGVVPADHRSVLRTQFRMHRSIGKFVRDLFYRDIDLKHGAKDEDRKMPNGIFDREERVFHLNVRGHERRAGKTSLQNDTEIDSVLKVLAQLDRDAEGFRPVLEVAVMAAYKGQVKALKRRLEHGNWQNLKVCTATVDSFQGRQADVVLYSTVRTAPTDWDFIGDARRLNVAFSRPKRLLVLVGHRHSARQTPILRDAIDRIDSVNLLELGDLR